MNDVIIERNDQDMTVRIKGEIDHHTARDTRERMDNAIERFKPKKLFLDMSGVSFMDSSGIGLIMGRYRLMLTIGGTLCLTNLPKQLERLIRLAGLDKLPIYENRKENKNETDQ